MCTACIHLPIPINVCTPIQYKIENSAWNQGYNYDSLYASGRMRKQRFHTCMCCPPIIFVSMY